MRHEDEALQDYNLGRCVPAPTGALSLDVLPSWVPDWRDIGQHGVEVYPINHFRSFHATAGMPGMQHSDNVNRTENNGLLLSSGCRVDVITEVMQPPQWKGDCRSASKIVDAESWLASIRQFTKLGPQSSPNEDYVWRTIMLNKYDGVNRPNRFEVDPVDSEKALVIRKVFRREQIDLEALTGNQRDYLDNGFFNREYMHSNFQSMDERVDYIVKEWPKAVGSICRGRMLFRTAHGMLGLGHVAIRPGDFVTLLWGVRSPIILRQRSYQDGGGFTFVGDAYVDGIMFGEFLETGPAFEDFDIY
jgi:hypothetical protein